MNIYKQTNKQTMNLVLIDKALRKKGYSASKHYKWMKIATDDVSDLYCKYFKHKETKTTVLVVVFAYPGMWLVDIFNRSDFFQVIDDTLINQ